MTKIRGNRIIISPAADAEMPENERRCLSFINPSVTMYERVLEECTTEQDAKSKTISLGDLATRLLRGWDNIRTDDPEIATKYGVNVKESEPLPDAGILIPWASQRKIAFDDLFNGPETVAIYNELFTALNPQPSGNFALPPSSQPATSVTNAGSENVAPPSPPKADSPSSRSSGSTSPAKSAAVAKAK